jgi:carbohydrate diacid regulator
MIKLSEQLAQKIVDKMMQVIPYNVIITDEQGIIIGSGNLERIHKFHSIAKKVLELEQTVEIYNDCSSGVKTGVNCPIFFQGKLVGVIGIAGNPDIVKPFSELASVTVELLINQEYVLNQRKTIEQEKQKFLYELAYATEEYSQSFIERGLLLGIDITVPHAAVVINFNEEILEKMKWFLNSFSEEEEYYLMLNPSTIAVFLYSDKLLIKRLERCLNKECINRINLGIGLIEPIVANSLNQALRALDIGKKLESGKNIHFYKDLYFISMLANFTGNNKLNDLIKKLKLEGTQADLLWTLAAYVYNNGEAKTTSDVLHIHRNTLNYRLERIEEISGKNPRNLIELFELFTAYVVSML